MPAKSTLDQVLQRLAASPLRTTKPRRAILALLTRRHGPFTVEEISTRLEGSCNLVTLYRSLSALEAHGLVQRCEFGDGVSRYEINLREHHHHHLICRKCHAVETLHSCGAEEIERAAAERGYSEITHTLEIFGVCGKCRH